MLPHQEEVYKILLYRKLRTPMEWFMLTLVYGCLLTNSFFSFLFARTHIADIVHVFQKV